MYLLIVSYFKWCPIRDMWSRWTCYLSHFSFFWLMNKNSILFWSDLWYCNQKMQRQRVKMISWSVVLIISYPGDASREVLLRKDATICARILVAGREAVVRCMQAGGNIVTACAEDRCSIYFSCVFHLFFVEFINESFLNRIS